MKSFTPSRTSAIDYAVALAAVIAATVARWLLDPALGDHLPYVTYFVAVAFVAWFCGLGPSIFATLLGSYTSEFFFFEPRFALNPYGTAPMHLAGTASYFMVNAWSIFVCQAMHRARHAAEARREALRVTLASIGDAVIATDDNGRITYLNAIAETLTGWTSDEAVGRTLDEVFRIVNEQTGQAAENPARRALREGVIVGLANHTVLIKKDGSRTPIDDSAAPIRNEQGGVTGVVLVFRDVAERRRVERVLRESEARKSAILETSLDGIITIDHQGKVLEFNTAAEQMFGFSCDEVLGREMAELIIPAGFRDQHRRGIAHFLATGEGPLLNRRIEIAAVRADGSEFPVEVSITPTGDRSCPTFTGYIRDLTERRRIEQRLATQYAVSRALAEGATLNEAAARILCVIGEHLSWEVGALWFVDQPRNCLRCAEVYHAPDAHVPKFETTSRQLTFEPGVGLPGRVWATGKAAWIPDVVHDNNFPRAPVADSEGLHGAFGFPILLNHEVLGVIEFFSQEIRQPDDDLLRMMTAVGDQIGQVIHRRRVEEAMRATERRLAAVVESSDDAIVSKTLDGTIRTWNAGAERLFGHTASEAIGQPISLVIPTDRAAEEEQIIARLRAGEPIKHYDTVRIRRDGRPVQVSLSISPIKDDAGQVIGASKIARDITERKRMENELRQTAAELSEADRRKNEFLAMLAHELRNPLAPIRSAVQILQHAANDEQQGTAGETVQSAAAMMDRQIAQMVRLIDDLLDVSRVSRGAIELRRERVELGSIVHHAVEAAHSQLQYKHQELSVSLPPKTIYLDADPTRIAQVIGNLLNNACKFTDKGGRIDLVVSVEWRVASEERKGGLGDDRATLSATQGVAGGDELGGAVLSYNEELPEGGAVWPDESDPTGGRVGAGQHRRGSRSPAHKGISESPEHGARFPHGTGDTFAAQPTRGIIESIDAGELAGDHGRDQPNAVGPSAITEGQTRQGVTRGEGRVTNDDISLTTHHSPLTAPYAVIRVRDNGIGIDPTELRRIFELFTQVDTSLERSTSGLGIGLTLVKNLVEMHGGSVEARSEGIGKGSEFIVRLPIVSESTAPMPKTSTRDERPVVPRRILVVDDNQDAANSLATLLRLAGHETHTAHDGQQAIHAADTFKPQVVLLDIGLPKLNGYEAARHLRDGARGKDLVLIALTGWGQDDDRKKSAEAGFDAHLVKPVDFAALRALLADHRPVA